MTLHRQATKVRAMRSVPSIPLHRMAGATRDWSAVSAYVRPARHRVIPDDGDTFLDFRVSDFLRIVSDDPATGGVIGISIMVGVVAVIGALAACGGWPL